MIVDVIKTELGTIEQAVQVPGKASAKLAAVFRVAIGQAADKVEVIDSAAIELREIRTQVAPDAESQHHLLAIADRKVIGAERGSNRVRFRIVPLELVEQLETRVVRCAQR
ncbi:hypothetical protein MnTg04_00302 [bacterium MnTg04]|nr:hypothetical protein MnTg04_00302 [bacterium MnTg04]